MKDKISRRTFLRLSTVGLGVAAGIETTQIEPVKTFVWGIDYQGIPRSIPEGLLEEEIPWTNPHLTSSDKLISRAFESYNFWRSQNVILNLPPLHHAFFVPQTSDLKGEYTRIIKCSELDITSPEDLINRDPGSGIVQKIRNTEDINKRFYEEFQSALAYVQEPDKRVSTSKVLAYFLFQNKGNIYQSMWDTVIFLKVMVRNNYQTLAYNASREKAELISRTFNDEFSKEIPFTWLVDSGFTPENDGNPLHYDFLPVNRVGGPYHSWNIMTWALCVEPHLVPKVVEYFYTSNEEMKLQGSGRIKVESDMTVAENSLKLVETIKSYL